MRKRRCGKREIERRIGEAELAAILAPELDAFAQFRIVRQFTCDRDHRGAGIDADHASARRNARGDGARDHAAAATRIEHDRPRFQVEQRQVLVADGDLVLRPAPQLQSFGMLVRLLSRDGCRVAPLAQLPRFDHVWQSPCVSIGEAAPVARNGSIGVTLS